MCFQERKQMVQTSQDIKAQYVLETGKKKKEGQCAWSENEREIVAGNKFKKVAMGPFRSGCLGHAKALGI